MYGEDPMVQDHLHQQQQQQQPPDSSMMMMDVPFDDPMMPDHHLEDPSLQHQLMDDFDQGMMDPYQQQQQQQDIYFDSEYVKAEQSIGHDFSSSSDHRVVIRQDSASSLDISLKKIEVMEDEYGKMKMALLSDLDDLDQDPDFLPSPCVPEYHPLAAHERPAHPPRQRSRDNLESIFGGGLSYTDPESPTLEIPGLPPRTDLDVTTESRCNNTTSSSYPDLGNHLNNSNNNNSSSSNINIDNNIVDLNFAVDEFHGHKPGRAMIEDPFPVCVSPELELSISGPVNRAGQIDTIPEVPEEEDGSPTAGDGVSRRRRGKTIFTHQKLNHFRFRFDLTLDRSIDRTPFPGLNE